MQPQEFDNTPEKKEIRDQLYSETFDNLARGYRKELRTQPHDRIQTSQATTLQLRWR